MIENMENYKWEDFLKESEKIAQKLPDADKDRLMQNVRWAYSFNNEMENKFYFWYSFGAVRIPKEVSGLPIDIFVSQNFDYLYRTGKVKVFFKITNDEKSVDVGIIENGKFYQKEFDNQEIDDETINCIIRFAFNNRFMLQCLVFGHYNRELYIKGGEFVDPGHTRNQFVQVKKIVYDEEMTNMKKWWGDSALPQNELDKEFNYNYFSRMHYLYNKELRFGQMQVIFSEWFKKKYDYDYFAEKDITMPIKIDEFFKEIRSTRGERKTQIK